MTSSSSSSQKWVVDHDGGVDDALAIMCLLHACRASDECTGKEHEVICFTTVSGNVAAPQAALNTLRIMQETTTMATNDWPPVYVGCTQPLVQHAVSDPWPGHGTDGLGNASFETPVDARPNGEMHGALALCHHIRAHPGCRVVALGPLTNIAMALKLDPSIHTCIGELYIMGGSLIGRGNASVSAEFNFHCDPEAAYVVVSSFDSATLRLVTWDVTEASALSWARFDELCAVPTTPSAHFMRAICRKYESLVRGVSSSSSSPSSSSSLQPSAKRQKVVESLFVPCDFIAMICALYPELVEEQEHHYGEIELSGKVTRGFLAIDWYDQGKRAKNMCAITKLHQGAVFNILKRML